jgi:hypothetical protein
MRDEYFSILSSCRENFDPAHTSLYPSMIPDSGYAHAFIDSILFEVDGPVEKNYGDTRRLYSFMKLKYNCEPRVYFSGNRSFHFFVDFVPIVKEDPLYTLQVFAKKVSKELNVEFDWQIYSSIRKLSRVPLTIHEKTIRYCVPVLPFWRLEEILKESSQPKRLIQLEIKTSERLKEALLAVRERKHRSARPQGKGSSLSWIEQLLQHPVEDGRHRLLWHVLAPYLINVKKLSPDQAEKVLQEYFEKCNAVRSLEPSSYSFKRLIRYYLKSAEKHGYPPWRLETIERQDPQLAQIVKEVLA